MKTNYIKDRLKTVFYEINQFIVKNKKEIELFRIKFLGQKGIINYFLKEIRKLTIEDRKKIGILINELKNNIVKKIKDLKKVLSKVETTNQLLEDLTKPGLNYEVGARHPLSLIRNHLINILTKIGFSTYEGPEIEDSWHNFTALNFPSSHPARNMQDTFFIEKELNVLLRPHTSSVQIRYMKENKPPLRILSFGKVYRNEVISTKSHCMFHQIEGLYVDKKVTFVDLKKTIQYFTDSLFGKSKMRFRPSSFPFTEPSAEVDVYYPKCSGWLEIMGCGMIDPQVLENVKIDSQKYSGFAFGIGLERIALLLYKLGDIRIYFNNDFKFLQQFKNLIF